MAERWARRSTRTVDRLGHHRKHITRLAEAAERAFEHLIEAEIVAAGGERGRIERQRQRRQ